MLLSQMATVVDGLAFLSVSAAISTGAIVRCKSASNSLPTLFLLLFSLMRWLRSLDVMWVRICDADLALMFTPSTYWHQSTATVSSFIGPLCSHTYFKKHLFSFSFPQNGRNGTGVPIMSLIWACCRDCLTSLNFLQHSSNAISSSELCKATISKLSPVSL